jgi:hypothetical protein
MAPSGLHGRYMKVGRGRGGQGGLLTAVHVLSWAQTQSVHFLKAMGIIEHLEGEGDLVHSSQFTIEPLNS